MRNKRDAEKNLQFITHFLRARAAMLTSEPSDILRQRVQHQFPTIEQKQQLWVTLLHDNNLFTSLARDP
jgi:hypothetical protein